MSAPLITTKLFVPQPHPNLIRRPRLIQRLEEGLSQRHRLALVSAPAGYGKTTLLSEWVSRAGTKNATSLRVGWLSLDAGDNDLARFLAYLLAAFDTVQAGVSTGARAMLGSLQPLPPATILTPLVNDLAAILLPLVLVLDDYQFIAARPVHDAVTFLLDHLPVGVHLVIATRVDPPLPLARLRVRGQLTEVRVEDLRFTTQESAELLNQVAGLGLSTDDVTALEDRTEGWAAGLHMASLAIRALLSAESSGDVSLFVREFSGSHRYVLDYLIEEVLQRQPGDVQDFLLQTSILQRLCGSLCDAVVDWKVEVGDDQERDLRFLPPDLQGASPGEAMLEYLDQANLFLVPLDGERRWYRYHRLFADLLRARLQRSQPELETKLHAKAARWLEQNGWAAEAIEHALAAQDFGRASCLAEQIAPATLWVRGEVATFLGWLEALPEHLVRDRPRLGLYHVWALITVGQLDRVEARLRDVERAIGEAQSSVPSVDKEDKAAREDMLGEIAVVRAMLANLRGEQGRVIELCHQALERVPEDNLFLRSAIAGNLGGAYARCGDVVAAGRAFAEASRLSRLTDNTFTALIAASYLGDMQVAQGRLHQAAQAYRQALELANERGVQQLPLVGLAHVGLGGLLYEWNDLDRAADHLRQGVELGERQGDLVIGPGLQILADGYLALARLHQARGDVDSALEMIRKAEWWVQRHDPAQAGRIAAVQARMWVALGDLAAAGRWACECGLGVDDEADHRREFEQIMLARVLIAQGMPGEALRLLGRLEDVAGTAGRTKMVVKILALQAVALQAQDEMAQAMTTLERALLLAEPEGYVRTFADEGAPVERLLLQARSQGVAPRYLGELLAALGAKDIQPLVEPLSLRELEVLHLLAEGYSNQEIADRLVIAVTTAKKHASNIYGKLGVSSRTQAISRARELGLL